MEHSKVLIVIVSVSLFVAAVLGLGLVLFYPREAPQIAGTGGQTGSSGGFDAIEYLREPDAEAPALETEEEDADEEDVVIVYGETMEERPDAEAEQRPAADAERAPREQPEPQPQPQPERQQPGPEPEAETRAARPARAAPQRAPEPEVREVQVTEYWIQVIATTSRDRVEMARRRLGEHELSGRITTTVVDGRTFYRLRVGPYTNKGEASKFLDWVNDIDGFEESYISEEYNTRTVRG